MKVYIVLEYYDEQTQIHGIFASKARADAHRDRLATVNESPDFVVEEMPLHYACELTR